jgi:hypothetical protein
MNSVILKSTIRNILSKSKALLFLYIFIALVVSIQSFLFSNKIINSRPYTQYNNYIIFKQSFNHLVAGKDLYVLYPIEQWDLYKYSPTFALFFGVFAGLPDIAGLYFWNLLNAVILFFAIRYIPGLGSQKRNAIIVFILAELVTSMQSSQSNGLLAALIIFSFGFLERGKHILATLFIVLSLYLKIYGVVAFALFAFYPQKWKLIFYSILWMIVLFILPLVTISFHQLIVLYKSWSMLLVTDHAMSDGLSVMGWLKTWFNISFPKNLVLTVGAILFCLPFIRIRQYKHYQFRLLMLSALLLWVIIFNHKAESPTFIVAISGIAIWFFAQKEKKINYILLLVAFICTTLSVSDLVPQFIRENIVYPYDIKVIPCIVIWVKVTWDLIFERVAPELQMEDLTVAFNQ